MILISEIVFYVTLTLHSHLNFNPMKKAQFLLLSIIILIISGTIFAFKTQDKPDDASGIVIIRAFQYVTGDMSGMHIYYGDGKFEEIKLEKLRTSTQHENWNLIVDTVNKFYDQGYKLVSNTERGEGNIISTFVLSK